MAPTAYISQICPDVSATEKIWKMPNAWATEAVNLHIYGMERDHERIPIPSNNLSKEDIEGNIIMPITI